jgi:hypothetical protein
MKKQELRPTTIYTCDICGKEDRFHQCELCDKYLCQNHIRPGHEESAVLCPSCASIPYEEYMRIEQEQYKRRRIEAERKSAIREAEERTLKEKQDRCYHELKMVTGNPVCVKCGKGWK